MTQKVHWNPNASHEETWGIHRVAAFCGAITYHRINDQNYVVETRTEEYVTCKNCIRRLEAQNESHR